MPFSVPASLLPPPLVTYALCAVGAYALAVLIALPLWGLACKTLKTLSGEPRWANLLRATTRIGNSAEGGGGGSVAWALITGASTGMGREYALQLGQKGFNLVIIADPPTQSELEAVKAEILQQNRHKHPHQQQVVTISCDLLDGDVYEQIIFPRLAKDGIAENMAVLVNNVGMCFMKHYEAASIEADLKMMTLNMLPMVRMTKHILPFMKKRQQQQGKSSSSAVVGYESAIINMASLSGDVATPYLVIYGATKTFVRKFSDSLRAEIEGGNKKFKKSPISVTVPMPFGVKTPLYRGIQASTVGPNREEGSVDASVAVAGILKKIHLNCEHNGCDLHDVLGTLVHMLMSQQRATSVFGSALESGMPPKPWESQ